ncbi:hypothetical protein DCC39_07505 [Pueribacillus theae]|uniref:Uncharacterized protein n=1 Tax=Pueribacillus theae TaxID=2171751 RepID=A0A2U1K3H6_9BACI|nr:hypothetical protein [Pueribacillus theae]PWA12087.1 hypothetical protein DCC39_07505 [Pueribacillus theae]
MNEERMNLLIGEIVAINEEIEEFSAEGLNVSELVTERNRLIVTVDRYLMVHTVKAAPGATGTAQASL